MAKQTETPRPGDESDRDSIEASGLDQEIVMTARLALVALDAAPASYE